MDILMWYDAAARGGLLTPLSHGTHIVNVVFRAPDTPVLQGFAFARDTQIEYPTAWLTLLPGDVVVIANQRYNVRSVQALHDGSECLATLTSV